jgi:hypothetical protein
VNQGKIFVQEKRIEFKNREGEKMMNYNSNHQFQIPRNNKYEVSVNDLILIDYR